jgi:hypothetical protein
MGEGDGGTPRSTVTGVYEMLWDCAYCAARELLGRTHRYCPGCGAPQDPAKRYFPPEGKETVASAVYDGADRSCPACQTATGAKSKHCAHCGAPLDGAKEVARVQPPAPLRAVAAPPPAPRKERSWFVLTVGALVLLTCLTAGLVNSMGGASSGGGSALATTMQATVAAHEWAREVDVEALVEKDVSAWCDELAPGAMVTARQQAGRGTRRVPDGETCTRRNVDRGDGTFEKREDCVPKFREEPVLAERCTVREPAWQVVRTERTHGAADTPAQWPPLRLAEGRERAGPRRETWALVLALPGRQVRCTVPDEGRWRSVKDGETREVPRGGLLDGRPCTF